MQPFKLTAYTAEATYARSVAWSQSGAHLAVGRNDGKVIIGLALDCKCVCATCLAAIYSHFMPCLRPPFYAKTCAA